MERGFLMATTVASRKAKGRRLQQEVIDALKAHFGFSDNDLKSIPGSVQGEDIWLSSNAVAIFPYSIECKCQESLNIWGAIKQCEANAVKTAKTPMVVFRRNQTKTYVVLELSEFLKAYKKPE